MGAIHKKAHGTRPDISGGFPAPELTAQRLGVPRPISLDVGFLLDVRPHELLEGLGLETDCTDKGVLIRSHGALLAQDLLVVGTEHHAAEVQLLHEGVGENEDQGPGCQYEQVPSRETLVGGRRGRDAGLVSGLGGGASRFLAVDPVDDPVHGLDHVRGRAAQELLAEPAPR